MSGCGGVGLVVCVVGGGRWGQGGDFRDTGMVGMYRFLERIWKLFGEIGGKTEAGFERKLHQTIKKVTEDLGKFKYNTAIAALMELTNAWQGKAMARDDGLKVVKLIAPLAPYTAEELWERLGQAESVHVQAWPKYDPELVKEEVVTVMVQVNGKVRSKLQVKSEKLPVESVILEMAREDERVKQYLEGKRIKNTIFVAGRLVNFVVE